jgi:hypothetical protein
MELELPSLRTGSRMCLSDADSTVVIIPKPTPDLIQIRSSFEIRSSSSILVFKFALKIRFKFSLLGICLFQTGFSTRFARFLKMRYLTTTLCSTSYSSLHSRDNKLRFWCFKLHRFKTLQDCTSYFRIDHTFLLAHFSSRYCISFFSDAISF